MFWSDFPAGMKGEIVKYPRNKYKVDFHNRNVTVTSFLPLFRLPQSLLRNLTIWYSTKTGATRSVSLKRTAIHFSEL